MKILIKLRKTDEEPTEGVGILLLHEKDYAQAQAMPFTYEERINNVLKPKKCKK